MYHYLGNFELYGTSKAKYSGYRCLCQIDNAYFDCQVEFVDRLEIKPGESLLVRIWFLSIDLVAPHIKIGNVYKICEGLRPIANILIIQDPWNNIEDMIHEGEVKKAVINGVDWTRATIIVEGGIVGHLSSETMGLKSWEEINQVLKDGEAVKVRVSEVDKLNRKIKFSFVDKII
ncbi:hypothetical protein [Oscillatoria salina]|uniref:hypothetical protein n=1 Tax=Oscillatoria salina TaxID=331517 RepID=UPI001CCEA7F5|nr:hypothetical protein [Oscillatoria salina]MBZ8183104.1 hypothetical protein [Oscillatoria salina IIICB1]MEC4896186.1 hypothetical protein [Oscillatoria sp. PMC 1050.18]